MPGSVQIRARTDADTKHEAEEILGELGLTPSAAINLFYRQIIMRRALPFPVEVPNALTEAAIEQARSGKGVLEAADVPALLAKLLSRRERTFDLAELAASAPELMATADKATARRR